MANEMVANDLDDAKEKLRVDNNRYKRSGMLTRALINSVEYSRNAVINGEFVKVYTYNVRILSRPSKRRF